MAFAICSNRELSLLKKTTYPEFLGTRAQVLTKLIEKKLSARANGTMNFKSYWLKNIHH